MSLGFRRVLFRVSLPEDAQARLAADLLAADGAVLGSGDPELAAAPADVVVLGLNAPTAPITAALTQGQAVVLVDAAPPPLDRVALFSWGDVRRCRPLIDRLRRVPALVVLAADAGDLATPRAFADVVGLRHPPRFVALEGGITEGFAEIDAALRADPVDWLALMAPPGLVVGAVVAGLRGRGEALLLHPGDDPWIAVRGRRALFDAPVIDGRARTSIVEIDPAGFVGEAEDADGVVVARGRVLGPAVVRRGQLAVADAGLGDAFGFARDAADPVGTLEAGARVLRPGGPPIRLVAADATEAPTGRAWAVAAGPCDPAAVRRALGVEAVVHAGAVLDDGRPEDLPAIVEPIRRERVARRLADAGFPVAGAPPNDDQSVTDPVVRALRLRCAATPVTLTSMSFDLDNRLARERLIAMIDGARSSVCVQSYIFDADAVGAAVAGALTRAARRGVSVRVLVDALWARHGELPGWGAMDNPVLQALAAEVAVRAARPIAGVIDLKSRDHRKLVVVDSARALVPGRNVSAHYYTGPTEIAVGPDTDQERVPWIDLSVAVEGSIVIELERRFAAAWAEAGGEGWTAPAAPEAAGLPGWVVGHRGLGDANTLDAQRVLIAAANRRIVLVNTFPMQHELQHALLARLADGVEVRCFTGHVRPWMGGGTAPFPGAPGRDLMTELIHGRFDPLVRAGASVYAVGHPPAPGWDPAVGVVLPHVHAKWLSVDGTWALFGSPNTDISSGYWDSELAVVVRAPAEIAAVDAWFEALIPSSIRFDPADPLWQRRAAARGWISQSWPSVLG